MKGTWLNLPHLRLLCVYELVYCPYANILLLSSLYSVIEVSENVYSSPLFAKNRAGLSALAALFVDVLLNFIINE